MEIGWLWFDDDKKRTLEEKVERAVNFYKVKYDAFPNVCFIHPDLLPKDSKIVAGVKLKGNKTIIKNHFWLGVEDNL